MIKFKILGGSRFFIKGLNQERNFNIISKKIPIFNIKRPTHNSANFTVFLKDEKKVKEELLSLNYEIVEIKNFGLIYCLKRFLKNFGVVVGLIFCLAIFLFLQSYVFNLKIIGLESLTEKQVEMCLFENGFGGFNRKSKIDTKNLEKSLINNLDKISLASVIIKGNTLVVNIKEKIINDEYENIDNFKPIISQVDGEITSIKLIQGTLKVKVGDKVKIGDVLVEPYIIDSSNQKRKVKAEAEIIAKVYYIGKEEHLDSKVEMVRTGKKTTLINLTFLGLNLTKNLQKEPPYASFETETKKVCISTNNVLPIYAEYVVFYETKMTIIEQPFESVKQKIIEKAREKALLSVEECDIIINEHYDTTTKLGKTILSYIIEVEKRIDNL